MWLRIPIDSKALPAGAPQPDASARTAEAVNACPKSYLYRRVVRAKLFIDAHYAEPIDVDCVSAEAALSKYHFIRTFRQIVGAAPHQYLTRVRIGHAKARLAAGAAVTDVCFDVGFSSLGSFSALFKRDVGSSPSAYRAARLTRAARVRDCALAYVPACFASTRGWLDSGK